MVLETTEYRMQDIIEDDPFIPMTQEAKDGASTKTVRSLQHQQNEDEKRNVNMDVHAKETICNAFPYKVYHAVQICISAKEMLKTLKVAFKGFK